jgi:hypothetical protein
MVEPPLTCQEAGALAKDTRRFAAPDDSQDFFGAAAPGLSGMVM